MTRFRPGWTTPAGGGLHLISDYVFDDEGRTTQVLGPVHTIDIDGVATPIRRATWTVYQDATYQVWTGQGYLTVPSSSSSSSSYSSSSGASDFTLINPVSITITDADDRLTDQIQASRSYTAGPLLNTDSFPQSSYVRWTTLQYGSNNLQVARVYHTIPASGSGSSGTNYDETEFSYDLMERQNRSVTPGGTITRTVFDVRDNAIGIYIGTDDAGATDTDPTGGGALGNNMVIDTGNEYDNIVAGGDNNLTAQLQYVDSSTSRVTQFFFDWRDRRTDTDGEMDFYQKDYFDNLNRVIMSDRYNTTLSGNLIARSIFHFDDQSRVYQTIRYGVTPSTGAVGNSLIDNTWFDDSGNVIKSQPAGAALFTKTVYDGIGRTTAVYTGYDLSETGYPTPSDLNANTIMEQSETGYDAASNVIQMTQRLRYHNATGNGPLGTPSSAQPKARVTFKAHWQDGIGRLIAVADYGTNGGSALVRPAVSPRPSDAVLVTMTTYSDAGDLHTTTDPAGMTTYMAYDDAGR